MSFKAAVCSSCHKDIQVPTDVATPVCPYCGCIFAQETAAPPATLSTLLGLARSALIAGNFQEAMDYFNRVIESDPSNTEAWMGKGKAAGWLSSLANMRVPEMLVAFNHAIANASDVDKENTICEAVKEVNYLITTLYGMARKNLLEYVALQNSWQQYLVQVANMLSYLEEVSNWLPNDRATLENIIHLCKSSIEGVSYRDNFDRNIPKAWTLTPQYETLVKSQLDKAADRLRAIDPNYVPPAIEKQEADSCFIVTATMGDLNHPTVALMRRFRDEWLVQKPWGRSLVTWYYRNGPLAAEQIKRNVFLQSAAFVLIVIPAAYLARLLLNGPKNN